MTDLLNYLALNKNLDKFQEELYKNEKEILNESERNDLNYKNTILHNLVADARISLKLKIKAIFILCDLGVNINAQNNSQQTCLHLAIINYLNREQEQSGGDGDEQLYSLISCLLMNGCDFTIVDKHGLCSYNYLKRVKNKSYFERLCRLLKVYYPTYWIAIDNEDMNLIRRLVNSWCKFINIKKRIKTAAGAGSTHYEYCTILEYARRKDFQSAISLFEKLCVQMNLVFSVFALNLEKIQNILLNSNPTLINFNLKNMNDSNATLKYYILRENSVDLVRCMSKYSQKFESELSKVSDYMLDKSRTYDIPVLFNLLKDGISLNLLKLIVKPSDELFYTHIDHTQLRWKGESLLFFAIDINLNEETLAYLLDYRNCQFELFTLRNSLNLSIFDYIALNNCGKYATLFNKILIDYILHSKKLRQQLAYNGFDFEAFLNEHDVHQEEGEEVQVFLSKVKDYQKHVEKFHKAVEMNNYDNACEYYMYHDDGDLFICNLIDSRVSSHNQSVLHRAVLNQNLKLLDFLLQHRDSSLKMDLIRDHCFRTPLHYAFGIRENRPLATMLLDYGFSENVFDKDGMSPLDFQERQESDEVQQLILLHKNKIFDQIEPNPWSFHVWTRLQQEKDSSKQITLFNSKIINHHHHAHGHWPTSRSHHHQHHCHDTAAGDFNEDEKQETCCLS